MADPNPNANANLVPANPGGQENGAGAAGGAVQGPGPSAAGAVQVQGTSAAGSAPSAAPPQYAPAFQYVHAVQYTHAVQHAPGPRGAPQNAPAVLLPPGRIGANFNYGGTQNDRAEFLAVMQQHLAGPANPLLPPYPQYQRYAPPRRDFPRRCKKTKLETPAANRRGDENEIMVPAFEDYEIEIPSDGRAACSHCKLNGAMFLMKPCNDYGLCGDCLYCHKDDLRQLGEVETCMFCMRKVQSYFKMYRAIYSSDNDDD